jgi:helix-turn-helix, Psq domain.
MKTAIEAVRNKELCSYKSSTIFDVPQTTLERYVKYQHKSTGRAITIKTG